MKEIDGIHCSLVEDGVTKDRAGFLRKLLIHNNFDVKIEQHGSEGNLFAVGVTDKLFNPVIYVYGLCLKTPGGKIVTSAYWLQLAPEGINKGEEDFYWNLKIQ